MAAIGYLYRRNILLPVLKNNLRLTCRSISTSEKKKDSSSQVPHPESSIKKIPDFSKPLENKNWVSYGFFEERVKDRYFTHLYMFCGFTLITCGTIFLIYYFPDRSRNEWAKREAFMILYEREKLGLDPIDKNFIDPDKIILPPDEELEEEDIII